MTAKYATHDSSPVYDYVYEVDDGMKWSSRLEAKDDMTISFDFTAEVEGLVKDFSGSLKHIGGETWKVKATCSSRFVFYFANDDWSPIEGSITTCDSSAEYVLMNIPGFSDMNPVDRPRLVITDDDELASS